MLQSTMISGCNERLANEESKMRESILICLTYGSRLAHECGYNFDAGFFSAIDLSTESFKEITNPLRDYMTGIVLVGFLLACTIDETCATKYGVIEKLTDAIFISLTRGSKEVNG